MSLRRLNEHFAFQDVLVPGQLDDLEWNSNYQGLRLIPAGQGPMITGISRGEAGQRLLLTNIGNSTVSLLHQNAGSAEVNRLLIGGSTTLSLPANGIAYAWYDGDSQRWRVDR